MKERLDFFNMKKNSSWKGSSSKNHTLLNLCPSTAVSPPSLPSVHHPTQPAIKKLPPPPPPPPTLQAESDDLSPLSLKALSPPLPLSPSHGIWWRLWGEKEGEETLTNVWWQCVLCRGGGIDRGRERALIPRRSPSPPFSLGQ